MKKVVTLFATVVACMVVVAGTASASGGGGTVVERGFACGLYDGNGNIFITYNSTLTVYANQQSSKAVLRCSGYGAPAPSLTILSGFGCNTQYGFTYDSTDKIGRNGNSQLTCTVDLTNAENAASSSGVMGAG